MFRAYDSERDRLVAIKQFRLDLPPERVHQLVAEFEKLIAARLAHPAIVSPIATGITGNSAYLVHDFVAAESLDIVVREYGAAPPADALRVTAQLGGALDFAGVVHVEHGALHPRDVLLSADATKLSGLGIARALERVGITPPVRRPYSAPERLAGAAWDGRADVFALAALAYELLWARRVVGTGAAAAEDVNDIAGGDVARLRAVFARGLADDPLERYETALEFVNALKEGFPDVVIADGRDAAVSSQPAGAAGQAAPAGQSVGSQTSKNQPLALDARRSPEKRRGRASLDELPLLAARSAAGKEALLPLGSADAGPGLELPLGSGRATRAAEPPAVATTSADIITLPTAGPISTPPGDKPAVAPLPPVPPPASRARPQRSGVMPIAFALLIGVALGFAGGYGVGSRDRQDATGTSVATPAPAAPAAATTGRAAGPSNDDSAAGGREGEARNPAVVEGSLASEGAPRAQAVAGSLLVRSAPSGAQVTVDGRVYGRTPVTVRNLPSGAHRVEVAREGYAAEARRITITAAQPAHSVTVRLSVVRARADVAPTGGRTAAPPATSGQLTGPLLVESRPAGAAVFLDGREVGTTPLSIAEVAAGEHTVSLEREGYRAWSASIRILADQGNRVTASLDR